MKKIMVSVILIGLLIVIQNAFGFTFRGIEVGKALNEQMPRCIFDEFIKNREKYNYDLEKFRKDNNYDPKQICWSNYGQADSASFSVEHLPTIDIGGSVYVKTLDEKVEYITMNFGYFNADRFLTILKAKYGEPVIKKSAVQNRMGASFDKVTAIWIIEDCELIYMDRSESVDYGILIISSKKYIAYLKAKEAKILKETGDKL